MVLCFGKDSTNSEGEATIGFEPTMEVLQTSALPLGYVAVLYRFGMPGGIAVRWYSQTPQGTGRLPEWSGFSVGESQPIGPVFHAPDTGKRVTASGL